MLQLSFNYLSDCSFSYILIKNRVGDELLCFSIMPRNYFHSCLQPFHTSRAGDAYRELSTTLTRVLTDEAEA